ncbi:MAG: hypothetical protein LBB61_00020 [Treponema sp.]|jgi:two-component system chemotaxis sensor kinase CheA|nr:hypothetical protein [Treponema sp.]
MNNSGKNRNRTSFRLGNVSAFFGILALGLIHIAIILVQKVPAFFIIELMGVVILAGLVVLIILYRSVKNYKQLAFWVPATFFAVISVVQVLQSRGNGWYEYYLPLCIACCILSCLYDNYFQTFLFVIIQNMVLGIMTFSKVPFMGANSGKVYYVLNPEIYEGIPLTVFGWVVSLFAGIVLLAAFGALYRRTKETTERRDSFKTLMETTPNYIAMVDELNRVTNISNNLAKLTHLENPDLAIGRPVIDFFPSMEMKELAGDLLRKTERVYEKMWECWIDGEHRYFKALGDNLPDEKGILINLIDMTHLAERDEIAAMKDSLDIGLFFMGRDFIIQDNYSKALPRILGVHELHGMSFLDLLAESVMPSELTAIEDYFDMIFEKQFDWDMLNDINPLNEFHYCSIESRERKILHVEFTTVERGHGETVIMGSIYDITAKIELQRRLAEEEKKRQEEMRSLFELINVEPKVFNDFIEDVDYEFKQIDGILKNNEFTQHEMLVEIYKSVHAIKSNAVILGLAAFGGKVHALESEIKRLREAVQDVPFDDMLHLTLEIEKLMQEKEHFRVTLSKINTFRSDAKIKSNDDALVEALTKACSKASEDLAKQVNFVADLEPGIVDRCPRRVLKDVLMQLVRNSVVHGVEPPDERAAKGKSETGTIRLSIKAKNNMIYIRMRDDGKGIDYDKIRQKALNNGFIKNKSEGQDKNRLLQLIFSPGFSTADTETVHGGRGIGLNIVHDKLKELGGSLKVQSEKDKGTAFNLYIPVQLEASDQEKAAS